MAGSLRHPYPLSASTSVPVGTTPLLALTALGTNYESLLFALIGPQGVSLIIDTSEDGTHTDDDKQIVENVGAGGQASHEIGPQLLRSYFAVSVSNPGPGAASIRWEVAGVKRDL